MNTRAKKSNTLRKRTTQGNNSKWLNVKKVESVIPIIKEIVGGIIGLTLTTLFFIVILIIVVKAFLSDQSQASQLLNTVLTVTASAISAVLGYFLGRSGKNPSD